MKSPFEKKFCGKSPLKELTAKQEANLPEALKTAIEAKSPTNYGSPLDQIDPKLAVKMAKKTKQADRYKKYVERKQDGYIEDNSSDYMSSQEVKPNPSTTMDFNRFVVGEEIAKGGKRGSKAYKHHLNVSKAIKAGKKIAEISSPFKQTKPTPKRIRRVNSTTPNFDKNISEDDKIILDSLMNNFPGKNGGSFKGNLRKARKENLDLQKQLRDKYPEL
jgi:hypothetical protein